MKDIAIYGAGGFGREVACLIKRINEKTPTWNLIGFFDDNPELKGKMISHFGPCLGGIDELNAYAKPLNITIPIGNPRIVKTIVAGITNPCISFPNIIHPNFEIVDSETFSIGRGNIIEGGCFASCDVSLGDFNVLNGSIVFGHDCKVGSYNIFMPDMRISGGVCIGECNLFGVGSIILQGIKIGCDVNLAPGSVLMTQPKNGNLYIGVPAKKMVF